MSETIIENEITVSQDSKNMALLVWIGTLFFGFIPGLIFFLIKKDDDFVYHHSKEALNWSITSMIAYFIAFILTFVLIGAFLIPIIALCHLIFCIVGAVKASGGIKNKTPLTIRLIK